MLRLLVLFAAVALASANLKELLAGGGDHHGHHGDHHGGHHGAHHGDHAAHHAHHDHGDAKPAIEIVSQDFVSEDDGTFNAAYESANGIRAEMSGENRQIGDNAGIVMQGSYTYTTPEGTTYTVTWTADEEGFKPVISK